MEIKDIGVVVASKKYDETKYILDILTKKNGKWRGIYSVKHSPPLLGSLGSLVWSSRSLTNLGKIMSFETTQSSPVINFWNNPKIIGSISSIVESASKFIPERCYDTDDFELLYQCIHGMNEGNYIENLMKWDKYLMSSYFSVLMRQSTNDLKGLGLHIKNSSEISTKARDDLLFLLRM